MQPVPAAVGRLNIALLVRSLDYGGAQRQLVTLAAELRKRGHVVTVMVFYAGPLDAELRDADVNVRVVHKRGRWDLASFLVRLRAVIQQERPDIVHGYLDGANIAATILRPAIPGVKIVWGERSSERDLSHYDWVSRSARRLAGVLCRFADLVIVNSRAGLEHAVRQGYPRKKLLVIPNGIDTDRFAPNLDARVRLRREWNVSNGERLIGLVGRLDPVKGHRTFLAAAALVMKKRNDVRFVCVGDGDPRYASAMQELARNIGLSDRISWVRACGNVTAVFNALDVACSSSDAEGFPNVLGEAMACGVPCVATDVGDSAWIIGDPRFIAPPASPEKLAECIESALTAIERDDDAGFRSALRDRIRSNFSVETLTDATERVLGALVQGSGR